MSNFFLFLICRWGILYGRDKTSQPFLVEVALEESGFNLQILLFLLKELLPWYRALILWTAKPDLGRYWFAKYGVQGSLENESVINNLDEALGQLGEVQRNQNQIPGSIHAQRGKTELLTMYTRICAMEAELLQGVADKATIERLEKEIADANVNISSATSAIALKDAEIKKLKEKIEADAKEHENALGEAEYMAGEQALFYGELIMAYVQLAHPEIDFTDPQFVVSDPDDVLKYNKIPDIKDYLRDYVRKWMKGPVEESKPSTNVRLVDLEEVPPKAGEELITEGTLLPGQTPSVEKEVSLVGASGAVEKEASQAGASGEKNVKENALVDV
ncbi:uncharacterized protein [Euphorbia lathyris]|uniref:uncharacterized protein n=1 Tax=Euphorbia lathyris TaxID=212925 RepID=UPI003313DC70